MTKSPNRDLIVLDTSVILYDSECINKFSGCDIVIPLIVLDEIDKFRRADSQIGRNARRFVRNLKTLKGLGGDYSSGLKRRDTGELVLVQKLNNSSYLDGIVLNRDKNDDKIIATCLELIKAYSSRKVYLATKDIALSVKASTMGIKEKEYNEDGIVKNVSSLYSGTYSFSVPADFIGKLYEKGSIEVAEVDTSGQVVYDNAGVLLSSPEDPHANALTIYKSGKLNLLKKKFKKVHNIEPKNKEQSYAMELLFDPKIRLVSLTGSAGTGKSLMAVACAIAQIDGGYYDRLVISRPIQPLGKDIGYLPGSLEEKFTPWLGPIFDAIEFVFGGDRNKYHDLMDFGKLEIEPLTYIRGRSLPNTLFLLDEGQNVSPHEMKTVITRMGTGSKLILTGDVNQIDNNYLDTASNGLTQVIEKFKSYNISGHITLKKGQRSRLASLAAKIL